MKKNIETEVKIRLSEQEFDKRINQLWKKFTKPEFFEEYNDFYKVPKGFLRLKRYKQEVKVTLKGPRQDSDEFNSREEIEFRHPLADYQKLVKLYDSLGFKKHFHYTKQRANYPLACFYGEGFAIISFDILPNGEKYIEIEHSEKTIRHIISLLNLEDFPREKRSYLEMLMERENEKS